MQYEHRYMLELSRFRAPDGEKLAALMDRPLHYPYILGQLLMHRMGAAAYVSLERCGLLGRVNREFRNALQCLYEEVVIAALVKFGYPEKEARDFTNDGCWETLIFLTLC